MWAEAAGDRGRGGSRFCWAGLPRGPLGSGIPRAYQNKNVNVVLVKIRRKANPPDFFCIYRTVNMDDDCIKWFLL